MFVFFPCQPENFQMNLSYLPCNRLCHLYLMYDNANKKGNEVHTWVRVLFFHLKQNLHIH